MMRKNRIFTAIAVAALALGIGANTAIFTVVDTVLLQPLPYPQSDRMMRLGRQFRTGIGDSVSIPKFMAWRQNQVFDAMALYDVVIGILPNGFHSAPEAEVWVPLQADPNSANQGHYLNVAGRLKSGVTIATAQAQLKVIGEQFRKGNPKWMDPGAEPSSVAGMIVRQGGLVTLAGIGVGLATAAAGSRLIESLLYGVSSRDPGVFAATTLTLLAVALLACWLPARRAARLSPIEALRTE
jgi:hypothetical protein